MVLVAVLLVFQAAVMLTPGEKRSTQVPKFDQEARTSLPSVAPTVRAVLTLAGEDPQASALLFPAAMAYTTPEAIEFATAWSSAEEALPPRLILATAGLMAF